LDSLLAHYTAFRKKRSDDAYTPGGKAGARPNRAATVYTNLVRQAFPGLPVILGGMEASMRRVSHYDFWTDALRRSILLDAKAELLCFGMAETALIEAARRLDSDDPQGLVGIPGTARIGKPEDIPSDAEVMELPSHEAILDDPALLVEATLALERHVHHGKAWAVQKSGDRSVLLAPPAPPLSTVELDELHELPYARASHPAYSEPVPALEMIKDSIVCHRGCGGACAFCGLALHQGRRIASRSKESILRETATLTDQKTFRGSISDVGGPTANMWNAACDKADDCQRSSCLFPNVCRHYQADLAGYVNLLRDVRDVPGVKHVRVASGIRYELALTEPEALDDLVAEFVGGQLKVAPEHISSEVLRLMRKPGMQVFERLMDRFGKASRQAGKEQYLVPYLMSGHPGCTETHMDELAAWLKQRGWRPQQVQCFIPLPGTLSAAMFFSGVGPDGKPVAVARTDRQRLAQHHRLAPRAPQARGKRAARPGQRSAKPGARTGARSGSKPRANHKPRGRRS
jgi:uncharacterized radical SAM protein YgiQ